MSQLTPTELAYLRSDRHDTKVFVSPLVPRVLWQARVDDPGIAQEARSIAFDSGSGLNFSWIEEYQTVWIGTSAQSYDIGKARIRAITSGDGGVTGLLEVGANPLVWSDNLYLTFVHEYALWGIAPRIDSNQVFYKDYDITYSDENTLIPPVAIAGPHQAGFIPPSSTLDFFIPASDSYAITPGASIVSYGVSVTPSTGATVVPLGGNNYEVQVSNPGQYWVKVEVTDSNGKSEKTFRSLFAHPTLSAFIPKGNLSYPIYEIESLRLSGSWQVGGWQAEFFIHGDANTSVIPDETLVVIWQESRWAGVSDEVSVLPYGSNLLFVGYLENGKIISDPIKGSTYSASLGTVERTLNNLPMFSIPLEVSDTVDDWYKYLNGALTMGRICHFVFKHHSTLLQVCDLPNLLDDRGIDRKAIDMDKNPLYSMLDDICRNNSIHAHLVCDKTGRMWFTRDLMMRNDSERASATVVALLTDLDVIQPIEVVERKPDEVSFIFISGLAYDSGTGNAAPIGSTAPATWPGIYGSEIIHLERQMFDDQTDSNERAGQLFAAENNPYPEVQITFAGNYLGALEIALPEWWTISLDPTENNRALSWTEKRMVLRNVTASLDVRSGFWKVEGVFEPEVDGVPGVPYQWPDDPINPVVPPPIPPPIPVVDDRGIITASSVYLLPYSAQTWGLRTADPINDMALDPYWTVKQGGDNIYDAVLLSAENGRIRRSLDAGQTWAVLSPGNPPNDSGDVPAPELIDLEFFHVESNLINSGHHVWLARWQNGGGEWRSWVLKTTDDGGTFAWESIGGTVGGTPYQLLGTGATTFHLVPTRVSTCEFDATRQLTAMDTDTGTALSLTEVVGTNIVVVDNVNVASFGAENCGQVVKLDDGKALFVFTGYTPGGMNESARVMYAVVVTESGGSLVLGPVQTILTPAGDYTAAVFMGAAINIQRVFIANTPNRWSPNSATALTVDVNGTTVSVLSSGSISGLGANWGQISAEAFGTPPGAYYEWFLVYFINQDMSNRPYAISVRDNVTIGTETQLSTDAASFDLFGKRQIANVSPNGTVLTMLYIDQATNTLNCVAASVSSYVISPGTPVSLGASPVTSQAIASLNNGDFVIAYAIQPGTTDLYARSITLTGVTITDNADQTLISAVDSLEDFSIMQLQSGNLFISAGNNSYHISSGAGSTGETKLLGGSLSKLNGTTLYLTSFLQGTGLVLHVLDWASLSILAEYNLGASTLPQVDAKTFWAFPYATWGDDGNVFVFGRMANPASLGLSHIVYSSNSGVTFSLLENSWGNDHCGALTDVWTNWAAIRNLTGSTGAMLYTGSVSFSLRSSLPFPAWVNPHSLAIDFNGNILACAATGNALMVLYTPPPYSQWSDITFNHAVVDGINAIIVL